MKRFLLATAALSAFFFPALAWSCDGTAGHEIAVSSDGQKFTVTNMGREWVSVAFTAFGSAYSLQLAPGQSDSPHSPGMFSQPMRGYEACVATPLPVASSGVGTFHGGP